MSLTTKKNSKDHKKLLLIFIHGFKGDNETFQDFPEYLQDVLTNPMQNLSVESIVYEKYETRGDFKNAVNMFCSWLEDKVSESNGKGDVWIILIGHSMGGILAADVALKYASRTDTTKSPNIIGLLAFDSPFYGVRASALSNSAMERANKISQGVSGTYALLSGAATASGFLSSSTKSETNTSSGWGKLGLAAGIAAVAGGAAVYYGKKKSVDDWVSSHLEYVGILWDPTELGERVENLVKIENFSFRCYYSQIPSNTKPNSSNDPPRTFIVSPPPDMKSYFFPVSLSSNDEIGAHTCMFDPNENHFYFDLCYMSSGYLHGVVNKYEKLKAKIS